MNVQLGDLVAHKSYPELTIGHITEFYASGRVGVDDGYQRRSFLPKNLVVVKETQLSKELAKEITGSENTHKGWAEAKAAAIAAEAAAAAAAIEEENNKLIEMLETKLGAYESEVMEVPPAQVEEVENAIAPEEIELPPAQTKSPKRYESCRRCESQDLSYSTYQDPDEYYCYCHNCGYEEWVAGSPPAQEVDAIATDEVIERPPTHPLSLFQNLDLIASLSEVMELLPIPRDLIPEQMPEWWERPALPDMENPDCPIGDDEDDWEYALEFEFFFRAQYRGWLIETNDEKIYATEPSSKKCWWCECNLDPDGRDGQIAIAQEFIDSWYFAQPSPGQLSLNIIEAVARDPPTRPLLRLTA